MDKTTLPIALACDHGGYALKEALKAHLTAQNLPTEDFGCHSAESCDYPTFAHAAARAVADGKCALGVVVCTTGIGVSMVANKVPGVRCALCHEPWSAQMTRRHNDANMLAIGAGVTGQNLAIEILDAFLSAQFEGGRHQRRVDLIRQYEQNS